MIIKTIPQMAKIVKKSINYTRMISCRSEFNKYLKNANHGCTVIDVDGFIKEFNNYELKKKGIKI